MSMFTRKYLYSALALLAAILVVYFLLSENSYTKVSIDTLVKNDSWNIDFSQSAPFRKGDSLEYVFVLKWEDLIISLSALNLSKFLIFDSIELDGKKISEKSLNSIRLNSDKPSILKIKWKAICSSDSSIKKDDLISIKKTSLIENVTKPEDVKIEQKTKKPSKIVLSNTRLSSDMRNLVEISWKDLLDISFLVIWEKSFPVFFDNWKIYVSVDENIFSEWDYFALIQLNDGEIIPITQKITFKRDNYPIWIWAIVPSTIVSDKDRYVVLQGRGFKKMISIQLSNNIVLKSTEFMTLNDRSIAVRIPKWIPSWTYHFNIMDVNWIYELKGTSIRITNN